MTDSTEVQRHYGTDPLVERVQSALAAAGLDQGTLTPESLAPLDQFHSRGLAATTDLAQAAAVQPGERVVDIGCGLGGPSRLLAARFGCHVSGLDLSPAFIAVAQFLADRCALANQVTYQQGDALHLPYANGSFDLAWTQHAAMNIADRDRLYAEAFRVLRPGGRLALYDVAAGPAGPPHFPLPWSRTPATSFLLSPADLRTTLERQGFQTTRLEDQTASALSWFTAQDAKAAEPPPFGLPLVMGPDFPLLARNLRRSLHDGRASLVLALLHKP